ncbi:hypothetical protein Tdes44962_MAKER04815 [Teratosphaeria destructans]|uniref:Uncharacterized protein n=1 Tax=Teratosphaeria destructans TaxID=418781 RepID=A0A9W7VZK3_9PEZI|nr:hypothetical protein Tdes44962_MAKER04815 [Teratosphaeria destructans]
MCQHSDLYTITCSRGTKESESLCTKGKYSSEDEDEDEDEMPPSREIRKDPRTTRLANNHAYISPDPPHASSSPNPNKMCWSYLLRCPSCLKNEFYWINCRHGRGPDPGCIEGRFTRDGHEVAPSRGVRNQPWEYWGREDWCRVACMHCGEWMYYFEDENRVGLLREEDVHRVFTWEDMESLERGRKGKVSAKGKEGEVNAKGKEGEAGDVRGGGEEGEQEKEGETTEDEGEDGE